MARYILKRLLWLIPIIIGVSFIIYCILTLTPGDPARILLGENATPDAVEMLREELGLNSPFLVRYFNWLKGFVTGDFGISYRTKMPVFQEVLDRFPRTVKLACLTSLVSIVLSIPFGIISAVRQYSWIDNVTLFINLILTSAPAFLVGLILILIFSVKLNWLPATGISTWKHFIMPSVAAALNYSAALQRMMRSSMLEVIRSDYIRTAKAKGAREPRVVMGHALQNAVLPVITLIGLNFGWQLGGTIVIEQLFAIPGIGTLLIMSVRVKDVPQVMTSTVFIAILAALINLAVDILYTFIDPRIKSSFYHEKKERVH